MKAILKFDLDIELASEQFELWRQEHGRYYGLPCGVTRLSSGLLCGYRTKTDRDMVEYVNRVFSIDSDSFDQFGCWLSSGGNLSVIGTKDQQMVVFLDGSRHGLRFPFAEYMEYSTWEYLETRMPEDCHPYVSRDRYALISLENALRCKHLYQKDLFLYEKTLAKHGAKTDHFVSEWHVLDYYDTLLNDGLSYDEYGYELFQKLRAHLYIRGCLDRYIKLAKQPVMSFEDLGEANCEALFFSMLTRHAGLRGHFVDNIELN